MRWQEYGRQASELLAGVSHGKREAVLAQLAKTLAPSLGRRQINVQTLRRAVSGLTQLQELAKPEASFPEHAYLVDAPVAVVEAISRWAREDREAARQALTTWFKQGRSISWIENEFRKRRPSGTVGRRGRAFKAGFNKANQGEVFKIISKRLSVEGIFNSYHVTFIDPPGGSSDFAFRIWDKEKSEKLGAIMAGPYQHARMYAERAGGWITRALAAAWVYDRVFLILPYKAALNEYVRARDFRLSFISKSAAPKIYVELLDGGQELTEPPPPNWLAGVDPTDLEHFI